MTSHLLALDGGTATLMSGLVIAVFGLAGIAMQNRSTAKKAASAHQTATDATSRAEAATTRAQAATTTAVEAKERAEAARDVAQAAIPSEAMVAALLEVVRSLQEELRIERQQKSDLVSRYERLWRLLVEDYPDVLAAAGLDSTWPES